MNKMLNKKSLAITALSTIMIFAIVSPSLVFVDAAPGDQGQGKPDKNQQPDLVCDGTYGTPETDFNFDGNVVVPDGALCNLYADANSIVIHGDLKVAAGGELWAYGHWMGSGKTLTVEGSIISEGADEVKINDVIVNGNVQIKFTVNGFFLGNSNIPNGDVKLNDNDYAFSIINNVIGGTAAISNNDAVPYPTYFHNISGNDIDGNLQCKNNTDLDISDNTVNGKRTGQCDLS
jgi:hypothetical protein